MQDAVWKDTENYESNLPVKYTETEKKRMVARWAILGRASARIRDGLPATEAALCDEVGISLNQLRDWLEDAEVLAEQERLYDIIWKKQTAERADRLATIYFDSLEKDPSAARWRLEFERTRQIGKGAPGVSVNIQNQNTSVHNETNVGVEVLGAREHLLSLFKQQPQLKEQLIGVITKALNGAGSQLPDRRDISDAVVVNGGGGSARGGGSQGTD